MSRIGKLSINIPAGVAVSVLPGRVDVAGPKGKLSMNLHEMAEINIDNNVITVKLKNENYGNIHGLTRTLISNMVKGVTEGWAKTLELSGTGYRAATTGQELQLALGFSHPVTVKAPDDVKFEVKENKITVLGLDRAVVGELAAKIRGLKPADPYKAKGFKYEGEVIVKKAGKAAKAGA